MNDRKRGNYLMIERLMIIRDAIQDDYYPNTNALQKKILNKLGIKFSIPTLSRDIDFLKCRMGYPIEYDYHQKGYYWKKIA